MKRSEALAKVTEIKEMFTASKLLNTEVSIKFDKHEDATVIEDIILDKVTGFKLPLPERFQDGKKYTPAIFTIKTISSQLTFILEDVSLFVISEGIRIVIGERRIDVRKL